MERTLEMASLFQKTIGMFDKGRADYKKEDTASTCNEESAEKLQAFIRNIQDLNLLIDDSD